MIKCFDYKKALEEIKKNQYLEVYDLVNLKTMWTNEIIRIIDKNIIEKNEKSSVKYKNKDNIYENDKIKAKTERELGWSIIQGKVIKKNGTFYIEGIIDGCERTFLLSECYSFEKIGKQNNL